MARRSAALALVLLLLSAWLLAPLHRARAGAPGLRVVLVDVSASVLRTRPDWERGCRAALLDQADRARAGGERLAVVLFASDVALAFGPDAPARLPAEEVLAGRLDDSGTDLDGALDLTLSLLGPGDPVALVLLGGAPGDVAYSLGRLGPARASVARIAPAPARLADVAVTDLRLPRGIEPGAPLAVEVELALTDPVPESGALAIALELEVRSGAGARRVAATTEMPASAARSGASWSARVDLGPAASGRTEVVLCARLDGDPAPENDTRAAALHAGDELVVALAASPAAERAAHAWLGGGLAGLQVVSVPSLRLRDELPLLLADVDALVTVDLAAGDLPVEAIEAFVRGGGGWLACGGHRLFAGRPSALLPLVPADEDDPARDVVLLLDGSGSMAGAPFEAVRAAALAALELGRPRDVFQLVFFTDVLEGEQLLGPGGQGTERAAAELLGARLPRGPTDVPAVLEQLAAAREAAGREALVLLLSDGRDQDVDRDAVARRLDAARARLEQARARLVVIAMGEAADLDLLALVGGGQPVLGPRDRDELAQLFVEQVAAERLLAEQAMTVRRAEPALLRTPEARGVVAALEGQSFPALERLHRTRARAPEVEVLLTTGSGEPLVGLTRAGAGLCAVWTSAPLPGWSEAWAGSVELVGPLLRALARTRGAEGPGPRVALEAGVLRVAGASRWPPRVEAVLRGPGTVGQRELPLVLTVPPAAPGEDPRDLRVAVVSARDLASLRGARSELLAAGAALPVLLPVPPEFLPRRERSPGSGPSLPEAGASDGGPGGGGPRGGGPRAGHPAGRWVLGVALGLLALAGALGWEGRRPRHQAPARAGR